MATFSFSPATEEEFQACEAEYTSGNQATEGFEEGESSSDEEAATVAPTADESARGSTSGTDDVRQVDKLEDQRVNAMVNRSCGCKLGPKGTACSAQFSRETVTTQREDCLTLDKESLDMLVLGQLQAHAADTSSEGASRQKYVIFYFKGKRICRKFFMFIHTLSQKKYRNLFEHYCCNGTLPREHGNLHRAPHNRIQFEDVKDVISFIEKYAEVHAMPLPGRLPNYKSDKSLLLPSNASKSEIYRQYVTAKEAECKPRVSWAKFHVVWRDTLPHIDTMKPASDLCFECQTNMRLIQESANMSEEDKFKRINAAEVHLRAAKGQRDHYNEQCRQAKIERDFYREMSGSTYEGTMHYSFDYAQNVTYPSNPQQPGPAYFKSARKCGIFGVSCEPLSFQVNYLIDEGDDPGKGANATVSMLHHFLETYTVGEKHLRLHADNCVGQNKNNILMGYLMWHILTGLHKTIEISFMIRGHTKFAPDRFFGLIKKRFRHTFVSTLDELVQVVKNSMVTGKNIPQLTKSENSRLVFWLDWKSYLTKYLHAIPKITDYHHFRFDESSPGVVFVRALANDQETEVRISPASTTFSGLPAEITPKGLDITRQWYLYNEIRQFCSTPETATLTCPLPTSQRPSTSTSEEPNTTSKRKRACSHCHQEGHTKTKRGKITCPSLL